MYVTGSLFATVLFATVLNFCTSETIFIKTNSSSDHQCPAEPCLTLHEFVSYNHHVESNTVLKFLPGKHMILSTPNKFFLIRDVVNVTLTGVSDQQRSVVHCMSEFSIFAKNVQNLKISKLNFSGCGASILRAGPRSITLILRSLVNATILDTHVYDSKGAGMLAVNAFDLILNRSSFLGNLPNCIVEFMDETNPPLKLHATSYIANSKFVRGRFDSRYYGGGLTLKFIQTSFTVYVNVVNVALYNNTGINGNFLMLIGDWSCKYVMVVVERVNSSNGLRHTGTGFTVIDVLDESASPHQGNHSLKFEYTIHIMDICFYGSMDNIVMFVSSVYRNLRVKITDVLLYNTYNGGFGISFSNVFLTVHRINATNNISPIVVVNSEITICDAFMLNNEGMQGVITLWESKVTFLGNISLSQNGPHKESQHGAIYAYSSTLIFQGNVEFVNNTGYDGGALSLDAGSEIVIGRQAHLEFIGNHAKHFGGAIYVNNYVLFNFVTISCFFKHGDLISTSMNPHVVFENNTADYAGSALYGGYIDFCEIHVDDQGRAEKPDFNSMFQVNGRQSDLSLISSNPLRVCLCIDSRPECSITQYNMSAYPGTTVQIPAVAVGQRFGTVPSTIRSGLLYQLMNRVHPKIQDWQHTQKVGKDCTTLIYTIMSPSHEKTTVVVEVENLDTPNRSTMQLTGKRNYQNRSSMIDLYFSNLLINIEILQCPLGFEYHNTSMTCTCASKLVEHKLNCSIDSQTVWRKSSFWITTAEQSGKVIVHEHCPFDYCKPDSFDLDLENPDEQCAFNRSGILCGACQNNLSHVFGTSTCRECSSLWALLWVPVIALAGIALVVLLVVLNLTVSVGTINGLIFYANIVRANHATFFPPNTTNSFLTWFIAWINLDLGIETCFYNGLDAYVKTWLQFVFPLYIWFLVITIIVLSHYFTLAARLSGRNAVPVLATLFLLSYAKLLQVLITIFSSTTIAHSDGHQQTVWLYDGNVNYLKGKHAVLFTAALLVLLFLSVPYTTLLAFTQYIQLKSKYRIFRFWVPKLKPLLDAYTGPYKNKYRYWTGFLLLVRVALFLVFAANVLGDPGINLLVIVISTAGLFVHLSISGGVYKTRHLNILEYFFLFNLITLSSATLYVRLAGGSQKALIFTSVSASFTVFACIVVFHTAVVISSTHFWNVVKERLNSRDVSHASDSNRRERSTDGGGGAAKVEMKPLFLNFNELREPILEYCD